MTDTTVETPIVVHATPAQPQIEAGIRQIGLVVGGVAGIMGVAKVAGVAQDVINLAGPLSAVLGMGLAGWSLIVGQLATRKHAKQAATMAQALPDRIASVKP